MRTDTKLFMDGAVGSEASLLLRGSTAGSVGSSLGGSMGGRGGPEGSMGGLLKYWHRCSTNWSAMVGSPTLNYPSKCMKIHTWLSHQQLVYQWRLLWTMWEERLQSSTWMSM